MKTKLHHKKFWDLKKAKPGQFWLCNIILNVIFRSCVCVQTVCKDETWLNTSSKWPKVQFNHLIQVKMRWGEWREAEEACWLSSPTVLARAFRDNCNRITLLSLERIERVWKCYSFFPLTNRKNQGIVWISRHVSTEVADDAVGTNENISQPLDVNLSSDAKQNMINIVWIIRVSFSSFGLKVTPIQKTCHRGSDEGTVSPWPLEMNPVRLFMELNSAGRDFSESQSGSSRMDSHLFLGNKLPTWENIYFKQCDCKRLNVTMSVTCGQWARSVQSHKHNAEFTKLSMQKVSKSKNRHWKRLECRLTSTVKALNCPLHTAHCLHGLMAESCDLAAARQV